MRSGVELTMSELLKLIISKEIEVNRVISWLKERNKEEHPHLKNLDSLKTLFIPYFLNYLREQTSSLVQASHIDTVTKLTPRKTPTSKSKNIVKAEKLSNQTNARRVRLFSPGSTGSETPSSLVLSFDSANESLSPAQKSENHRCRHGSWKKLSDKENEKNIENHQSGSRLAASSPSESTPRHRMKTDFGEYLHGAELSNRHRSKQGGLNNISDENISQCRSAKNKNRLSKKNKNYSSPEESKTSSQNAIKDLESFPPINSVIPKRITPKRIKPTPVILNCNSFSSSVQQRTPDHSIETSNVFVIPQADNFIGSYSEERELLKKEKEKWSKYSEVSPVKSVPKTPSKSEVSRTQNYVDRTAVCSALPDLVTNTSELQLIGKLYSACISNNLVPNISVELYFILQLLTLKHERNSFNELFYESDLDDSTYVSSLHNCVYFAVFVLESLICLLQHLDVSVIKLLMDNSRIELFSSIFKPKLLGILCDMSVKVLPPVDNLRFNSVSFQAETDNQNNFPTDLSFRIFRKQRDMFYEVIRDWENNHLTHGWSLRDSNSEKIRRLVDMRADPINYSHFARLFISQLIVMCEGSVNSTLSEAEESETISDLIKSNPDKMKRLQQRLVTPSSSVSGPCPVPSFNGCQEFFRDFILISQSPYFIQHLIDHLCSRIHRLNESEIIVAEEELINFSSFNESRERFHSCVCTLRLLAKFLGFVVFLPYRTSESLSECITSRELSVRLKLVPSIDVMELLSKAIRRKRKVLVIPWIVEFLSMMDCVAPSILYYHQILLLLVYTYKVVCCSVLSSHRNHSNLLILVLLGWLFQTPNFPESLFQEFSVKNSDYDCFKSEGEDNSCSLPFLDDQDLVDQKILYSCCPYLGELRLLLIDFTSGIERQGREIKKITPVSKTDMPILKQSIQLQVSLENNFFHNHPASLKRTVEFVGDRIASNAIKYARQKIIPEACNACLSELETLVEKYCEYDDVDKVQAVFQKEIESKSNVAAVNAINESVSHTKCYAERQISMALPLLMPEDTSSEVIDMCCDIALRVTTDKVKSWCSSNITISYFTRELKLECDKLWKRKQLNKVTAIKDSSLVRCVGCHTDNLISPSELIIKLKELVSKLSNDSTHLVIPFREIASVVDEIKNLTSTREDVLMMSYKVICRLMTDLSVAIISTNPSYWTDEFQQSVVLLWKNNFADCSFLNQSVSPMISSRVIYQLSLSQNFQQTWEKYVVFVKSLIKEELIESSEVQDRFKTFLDQRQFSEDISTYLRCFLSEITAFKE